MSRKTQALNPDWMAPPLTQEEAEAQRQAYESHTLISAQDILRAIWQRGRITTYAYTEGRAALAAALHTIDNPGANRISLEWGAKLATAQEIRERERKHATF